MKSYFYNQLIHFDFMQHRFKSPINDGSDVLASAINQCILSSEDLKKSITIQNTIKSIYEEFEKIKKEHKDKIWVWDENYEHYEMDEIFKFLNQLWKDLDIKKELLVITSDIHGDYSDIFPYGDYYFTLHNMLLHYRRTDFVNYYPPISKNKIFIQGGSAREDRTYIAEQLKEFIPEEFYISTISENPYNQGADKSGKMRYTYEEMFKLIHDSNIMFVNETIRPSGSYFLETFEGKSTGYTEKTGNAILFKKPFLSNSNPYSLHNLREMGFKTFGDFWNESYDYELNQKNRIHLIMENVKWLSQIGDGGFFKLHRKLRDITEHNYKHLINTMNQYDGYKLFKPDEFNFKIPKKILI